MCLETTSMTACSMLCNGAFYRGALPGTYCSVLRLSEGGDDGASPAHAASLIAVAKRARQLCDCCGIEFIHVLPVAFGSCYVNH